MTNTDKIVVIRIYEWDGEPIVLEARNVTEEELSKCLKLYKESDWVKVTYQIAWNGNMAITGCPNTKLPVGK